MNDDLGFSLNGSSVDMTLEQETAMRRAFGRSVRVVTDAGEREWVPVDRGLPAKNVECLVAYRSGGKTYRAIGSMRAGYRGDISWAGHGGSASSVTHWMPLPDPPKEAA